MDSKYQHFLMKDGGYATVLFVPIMEKRRKYFIVVIPPKKAIIWAILQFYPIIDIIAVFPSPPLLIPNSQNTKL